MRQRHQVLTLLFVLLVASVSGTAEAQYFGRNKVQWEDFDFKVLRTDHFDIHYYSEQEVMVHDVARMAERWYDRLSTAFNHQFDRKPIVLYANHPDFQQTTTTGGLVPEGTGGFTDPFQNRVVMPMTGTHAETDHVLGHELVHVFQFDIARTISERGRRFRLELMPLWMVEGLAEYLSQGRVDPQTSMWMRDSMIHDRLPSFRDMFRDPRLSPYQHGQAFWAYVAGRWGDQAATELFVASGIVGIETAIQRVFEISSDELFSDWHAATRTAYEGVVAGRQPPEQAGEPVLTVERTRGDLNVGPALSPDGQWVAFLSTRDLFSIDLFLANAVTGEVRRRLVSSAADPHFDALRFIDSAGSWSPDGQRLAFVVIEEGDNTIAILDVDSSRIERRIRVPEVGAVTNPVWSPDGRTLAFSGSSGGITDVYVLDLETRNVRQITNDRFADIHPVWSPDGTTIAVASDRGPGTDFETLFYSPMRISLIDVETGEIRILSLFEGAKHINPQFSPDGSSIYFIADPEGVPDLFRYSLMGGEIYRLTSSQTGIAGITDLAPALTVASRSGRIMFSIFNDQRWQVHALDEERTGGTRLASLQHDLAPAGVLPPSVAEAVGTVANYLRRPTLGLPPETADFSLRKYRPSLHLDYLGPPSIGVGADRYGVGVGGSLSAYWSDVLGQHQVGFSLQGGGSTGGFGTQIGGQLFYLNRENRINWGAQGTHLPFVSAQTRAFDAIVEIDGVARLVTVIEQQRDIVTLDDVGLLSHYPLSRTRRFELNAGYTHYGFDAELERILVSGNSIIDRQIIDLPAPPSLAFYRASVAYVGDNSTFGFVSPVRGWRYRFEVEANIGDLNFQTGLADYRRYFFRYPLTFAARGLHFGRYGDDAEDRRLSPLYLGRGSLVRGYEIDSFRIEECTTSAGSTNCPEFDRLVGSKIGVVNLELRIPLFGTEQFGLIELPYFPTELVGFIDGGVAWTENESPKFEFDRDSLERVPVFSAGIAARIVLGGYLPLEFYYATPLHRPQEDWVFGFNVTPGW